MKSQQTLTLAARNGEEFMAKALPLSRQAFERALAKAERDPTPFATDVSYVRRLDAIQLTIAANNVEATVQLGRKHIPGLNEVDPALLKSVTVQGGGSILAFPRADVFLSVGPLLEQFFGEMEWGRRERRATASRTNGKKGGRPPKVVQQASHDRVPEPAD